MIGITDEIHGHDFHDLLSPTFSAVFLDFL